jgi:iron(III) transport system substrate-binding protein
MTLFGVALLLNFLCGSSVFALSASEWDKNQKEWEKKAYDAAKQEGKVVLYHSETKITIDAMTKAFSEKYPGIDLVSQAGRGGQLTSKVLTEQDAGKVVCDLFTTGTSMFLPSAMEGRVHAFIPPAIDEPGIDWLADPRYFEEAYAGKPFPLLIFLGGRGFIINTNLVPPEREPKSWKDFLDPWWKGKIISQDPRIPGSGQRAWWWMQKIYGDDFIKKLAMQDVAIERSYAVVARAVARGEFSLAIGMQSRELAPLEGAPIKFITTEEGVDTSHFGILFVKGAPHPNAGELLMNFLLSHEGQNIYGEMGARTPLRADAKLKYQAQNLKGKNLLIPTLQQLLEGTQEARDFFKKVLAK